MDKPICASSATDRSDYFKMNIPDFLGYSGHGCFRVKHMLPGRERQGLSQDPSYLSFGQVVS